MNYTIKESTDILIGKKIVLIETDDPFSSLKCGETGIITYVDSTGTIFAKWENGSNLGMIPDYDKFAIFFM